MSSIRDTIWKQGWDAVIRTLDLEQTPTGSMKVWRRPQSWPCWCQHFPLEMALLGFCPCKQTESESMSDWRQVATSSFLFVTIVPPLLTLVPSLKETQVTWLTKGPGADKEPRLWRHKTILGLLLYSIVFVLGSDVPCTAILFYNY